MSKLCKFCNLTVSDDQTKCPNCGATIEEATAAKSEAVNPVIDAGAPVTADNATGMSNVDTKEQLKGGVDKVKNLFNKVKADSKLVKMICGGVVAFIVLIAVWGMIFPSSKSVIKSYAQAMKKMDSKKIVSLMNKDMVKKMDEMIEESSYIDADDFAEYMKETFSEKKDDGYKIKSYEIDYDYDQYDKDDLEDLADAIEDAYDIKAKKVKAARKYTVKLKVKDDDENKTEKTKITLVKIGMKWYLYLGL